MCLSLTIDNNSIRPVQEVKAYPPIQGAGDKVCWNAVGSPTLESYDPFGHGQPLRPIHTEPVYLE